MNKQKLIDFETDIATCFNNAQIKAPIHLYSNNEEQLIENNTLTILLLSEGN